VDDGKTGDPQDDAALDWHILRNACANVLVTGPAKAVEQSLAALTPYLEPPVCYWTPEVALPSPRDTKTLVIRDLAALSNEEQRRLASWLEQAAVRVVSTTTVPLFRCVAAGVFLDVLYYRLNTVTLEARLTASYPFLDPLGPTSEPAGVPQPR